MEEGFTKFLLDKENDFVLYKMHDNVDYYLRKEYIPNDDRFQLLYYNPLEKRIDLSYSYAGIYDTQTMTVYNLSYPFLNSILEGSKIKSSDFGNVEYEMMEKLKNNLKQKLIENKNNIKKYGLEAFKTLQPYQIANLKRDTEKIFIMNDNPKADYDFSIHSYDLYSALNTDRSVEILKYLKTPEKYVDDTINNIIKVRKEEYGLEILKTETKENYLKELIKNKSNKYSNIYLNKQIYESIKYTYAKKLNITIEYGGKEMSFSFDYKDLSNALEHGDRGASDYGSNYSVISNFIKENGHSDKYNQYRNDFEFDHIKSIKYGKKELYNSNNFEVNEKIKNNNREER